MGKIVINQTDEKQTVILTNDAEGITGVYFGEDGVKKPVGGIEYKIYKPKVKTVVTTQNTGINVLGYIDNYRGWGPQEVTGLFLNQNQSGLGTSAQIIRGGTYSTAYITEGTSGEFSPNMNEDVRFHLYIPEGHEADIALFLEEVTE